MVSFAPAAYTAFWTVALGYVLSILETLLIARTNPGKSSCVIQTRLVVISPIERIV
jgi:hypothetical protein